MGELKIIATCSLCGEPMPSWWDREAMNAHLAEVHGLYFDPRPPWRTA
jgi:hypothetical protein